MYGEPDPDDPANWVNSRPIRQAVADANPGNAAQIVAAANLNYDFVPDCNDYLVILLVNLDPSGQPHLIWKRIPCPDFGSETVWASGEYTFIDERIARKWGWIFEVDCTDDDDDDE